MFKSISSNKSTYFKVSEISEILRQLLEESFHSIMVKGEVSGIKYAPSGHIYFNLKDDTAVLNAICWRNVAESMSVKLEDGMEVICTGKISSYPSRSNYQLITNKIEIEGAGALLKAFEKKRNMLSAEGLFDAERKKALPKFPKSIAIITSVTGAVIHDMLNRISARFPSEVIIFNSLVQGNEAAPNIVNILSKFKQASYKPDVIIIARGGGSIEDLWCFNDEGLVRAIAECEIPVVSAIGHETDFTLTDFVADLRAPTPTAAAELVVPVLEEVRYNIRSIYGGIKNVIDYSMESKKNNIQKYFYILNEVKYSFESKIAAINKLDQEIKHNIINYISNKFNQLSLLKQNIEKYNKDNILKMGFAIIKDKETKKIITSRSSLAHSKEAIVEMHDGSTEVSVKS